MIVLMILVVIPMLATDIYVPAIPEVAKAFQIENKSVLATLTAYMFGFATSLLLSGIASDRFGRRPVILVGLTIYLISSLGCTFAASITELTILRFLQALGGGVGTLLCRVVVRDLFDATEQVKKLSVLAAGIGLSPIVGPLLGGALVTSFGWRSPFYFVAALSLAALILVTFYLKESLPESQRDKFDLGGILSHYKSLLTHRLFIAYTLIISFGWAVYFGFLASSSLLIQGYYGLTPKQNGILVTLAIAGYALGTYVARKNIHRVPIDSMIRASSIFLIVTAALLATYVISGGRDIVWVLALSGLSLTGLGVIFPATQAGVMRPFPHRAGLTAGAFYAIEMAFGALTSWTLGVIPGDIVFSMTLVMTISATLVVVTAYTGLVNPQMMHAQA